MRGKLKPLLMLICGTTLLLLSWRLVNNNRLVVPPKSTPMYSIKVVKYHSVVQANDQFDANAAKEAAVEVAQVKNSFDEQVGKKEPVQDDLSLHGLMEPQRLTCQLYEDKPFIKARRTARSMTMKYCQSFCLKKETTFMGLTRGDTCICTFQHGATYVQKDSDCNMPCSGQPDTQCGGIDTVVIYKIDPADGNSSWSNWMRFPISSAVFVRSRYRKCERELNKPTSCIAELEKNISGAEEIEETSKVVTDHLIGCFTPGSFDNKEAITPPDYIKLTVPVSDADSCIQKCALPQVKYAVHVGGQCYCTSSLGWSQPADTCVYELGAAVYSTTSISDSSVSLVFEKRRTHSKVAVVAFYRGGSTLASALFYLNPGSLSVYELDLLMGKEWPNVAVMGMEDERSHIFLSKIYPAWFNCDSKDIPGIFYRLYPDSGYKFNAGLDVLEMCKSKVKVAEVARLCAAYLQEKCLISPIVSAKTVRILNAGQLRQAVEQNSDIRFVYVLRDPRAMQASRSSMVKWFREDPVTRLKDLCWEVKELHGVFGSHKNSHVLHYEDMAQDLIASATNIYQDTNITFTEEMAQKLQNLISKDVNRMTGFDIVQTDPKSRIDSWLRRKNDLVYINTADESSECKAVYDYYPKYYKSLKKLISL